MSAAHWCATASALLALLGTFQQSAPPQQIAIPGYPPLRVVPPELRVSSPDERRVMEHFDRSIPDALRLIPGLIWTTDGGPNGLLSPGTTAVSMLTHQVCASDLVATGTVRAQKPLVNDRVNAIFTIHRVQVRQQMRPNSGPTEIQIATLSGSAMTPEGKISYALDPTLDVGRTYAFIARRLEGTGIYLLRPGAYRLVDLDSATGYPYDTFPFVREFLADRSNYAADLARTAASCPPG